MYMSFTSTPYIVQDAVQMADMRESGKDMESVHLERIT